MYLICKGNDAIIIDPHYSLSALQTLKSIHVENATIILTHEHPDHTSGVNFFKSIFNSTLICNDSCSKKISKKRNNQPVIILRQLIELDKKNGTDLARDYKLNNPPYTCTADITFSRYLKLDWSGMPLILTSTPGHSPGSICIELNKSFLFTGDYLIKDTPVITRFIDSSVKDLIDITIPFFESLNKNITIFPGHGEIYHYESVTGNPLKWLQV